MKNKAQIFRDGVSQKDRFLAELGPNYIGVDERDKKDLLEFAQKYAKQLKFYNESNQIKGDWSPFFAGDVEEMVAYINNPESFADDESKLNKLSQPHLVLFFTFLELLRYPQQQFKELTQRYLDFYYKDVLKLTEKAEVADKVHTIFELDSGEETHLIKKGTLLYAGQDSQGVDLNYAVDEDIIINQAQVASLKNLFVEKVYISLQDIHQPEKNDRTFLKMLQWAVGSPRQGDELPKFEGQNSIEFIKQLYHNIKNKSIDRIDEARKNYILKQLFFVTIEDFKYCLAIHDRQINKNEPDIVEPTEIEWNQVYELVEKAYKKKINWQRRNVLKAKREQSDFDSMMKLALGDPDPGDSLPNMPEAAKNLDDLFQNLNKTTVKEYIKEQLYLSVSDFQKIINVKQKTDSNDEDWAEVYRLLEKAQTKKRNFTYPPVGVTKIKNIRANSLVDVEPREAIQFPTFSLAQNNNNNLTESQKHPIGFAIASPLLNLKEGKRSIVLTIACQENSLQTDIVREVIEENNPFEVYLSSETEWIKVESSELKVGDLIVESEIKSYPGDRLTVDRQSIYTATEDKFQQSDREQYLVFNDGKIYQIAEYINPREVQLNMVGQSAVTGNGIKQYSSNGIYLNSLQFQLNLEASVSAITPLNSDELKDNIAARYPVIKIILKPAKKTEEIIYYYEQLKSICLDRIKLEVSAENIQDLQLRNDNSVLDSKSPFQPFSNNPKVGSSFYFSNSEIISKPLDGITLNLQWMGLPEDLRKYYQAYSGTGVIQPEITNDSFKAKLQLFSNRSWIDLEDNQAIFSVLDNNNLSPNTTLNYSNFNLQDYSPSSYISNLDTDDLFEYNSYFKLELQGRDFGHDLYPTVLNKVALATDDNIKSLTVYPPYTPELKTISLNYTASVEIDLEKPDDKFNSSQIFQLHPFGYTNIPTGDKNYLLPQYPEAAALYIGIRNLQPPQNLSFLFQMVSGSGNVELTPPQITWSYLNGNHWQNFQETEILSDTTNGLLDTGIIRFSIPQTASSEHQLLPTGLYWLRATVTENPTAIPDILDIKTQAVKATYINRGNAAEHLTKPLPANSIQSLVDRDSAIKTIQQPYTSFGGKPQEDNRAFITRVSERLRHKQRAITPWDYERLVLEKFPQIYKVKCINSAMGNTKPSEARVTIVVIPDISNTAPFFPLEPKVPLYLLKEIEDYLKKHTSPFVKLTVKNPRYETIQYRVGVRFRAGYEQGYYLNLLNEDLKRFLSPWAYQEEADITFGSAIYSSSVIHFIEKRPYVDYVAHFKLAEQKDTQTNLLHQSETYPNLAQVQYPDSILVSAPEHIIDRIAADHYEDEDFEGIGYMIIGTDFVIN